MNGKFLYRHRQFILYGIALAVLTFLLKWLELRFIIFNHSTEIYIGFIAVIFTALGIWLAQKLLKPKVQTIIEERTIYVTQQQDVFAPNEKLIDDLGLSKREMEVLQLMSQGLSNQEIAAALFLSVSTIKSHAANIFEKLEVKRRTQAIEKARKLFLIA